MEKTQKIIITDTHFGRYNNSINFLNSQLLIFDDLKRFIKMNKVDRFDLIHLGDIFESRSTISTQISDEVRLLFKELNSLIKERNPENKFIFVAGNHDFFSPISDKVNSLDTYVRDWVPDAVIVSRDCWVDGDDIYIPWYWMNDPEKFNTLDLNPYHRIFTHCDCKDFAYGKIPVNAVLYSGHIHQCKHYQNSLSSNPQSILYNLSTPYSLDYGDSNDLDKGFWIINADNTNPILHRNEKSIRYRTFVNEQVLNIDDYEGSVERGDNFRVFVDEDNRYKIEYAEAINKIINDIKYPTIITVNNSILTNGEAVDSIDITSMLINMVPDDLKDIFNIVINEVNENPNK